MHRTRSRTHLPMADAFKPFHIDLFVTFPGPMTRALPVNSNWFLRSCNTSPATNRCPGGVDKLKRPGISPGPHYFLRAGLMD